MAGAQRARIAGFLGRTGALIDELAAGDLSPDILKSLMAEAEALAQELTTGGSASQRALLVDVLERVMVAEGTIMVRVKRQALAAWLLGDAAPELGGFITIEAPARLTRRGVETGW